MAYIELMNFGSILFGLIACVFPIYRPFKRRIPENNNRSIYSLISIGACTVSIYLQILIYNQRVRQRDFAALLDTSNMVVFAASALLIITLAINIISLYVHSESNSCK